MEIYHNPTKRLSQLKIIKKLLYVEMGVKYTNKVS